MQFDMFRAAAAPIDLLLIEHASPGYAARTAENARSADTTVAFAVDFTTSGERLTKKLAGKKYVGIPFGCAVDTAAAALAQFLATTESRSLNVAGNGICTLSKHSVTQHEANQWILDVLRKVVAAVPLGAIRSGGQTGVDTAGLVAALCIGIPAIGLYPHGFRRRFEVEQDILTDKLVLERDLRAQAAAIQ